MVPENLLISDVSKVVEIIKPEGPKRKFGELWMISENMSGEPCIGPGEGPIYEDLRRTGVISENMSIGIISQIYGGI